MDASALVGGGLCVGLLVVWTGMRIEDQRAKRAACHHQWRVFSVWGEGEDWRRHCPKCGKQEFCDKDGRPRD